MNKIIVYGSYNKNLTSKNLCKILCTHGVTLCFSSTKISESSSNDPEYVVIQTNKLKTLNIEKGLVVFNCNNDEKLPDISNVDGLTCLVNSQNSKAISKLSSLSIPAIVFGMSAKDTITLSSIDQTDAVISIQRELVLQSGNVLEPCEFKVKNVSDLADDEILMIASILILFEEYEDEVIEF